MCTSDVVQVLCTQFKLRYEAFSPRIKDETEETIKGERFFTFPNGSLQIISAEKDDSSKYVCVAVNTEGKSAITAVLDVKGISEA